LFDGALQGGAVALGAKSGIAAGQAADFVSLSRARAPYLKDDAVLDGWIFAGNLNTDCVWVHGVKQVEGGRHIRRERIEQRFLAATTWKALSPRMSGYGICATLRNSIFRFKRAAFPRSAALSQNESGAPSRKMASVWGV
jgi:hypothetical protein